MADVLHHDRFAALGRGHDQGALTTTDGGDDVDHAAGDVLFGLDVALQTHLLFGEQGREVLEHDLVLVVLGGQAVDLVEFVERKVAFAVFGDADLALDHVARVQIEAAYLARRDVDVVGGRGEAGVHVAQKAKAVGQNFEHAVGVHEFAALGALFDDGKHQLLFAHAAGVLDFEGFGLLEDFRHVQCLEFVEVHLNHSVVELSQESGGGALMATGVVGPNAVWVARPLSRADKERL